jgi:hypothetical protein
LCIIYQKKRGSGHGIIRAGNEAQNDIFERFTCANQLAATKFTDVHHHIQAKKIKQ